MSSYSFSPRPRGIHAPSQVSSSKIAVGDVLNLSFVKEYQRGLPEIIQQSWDSEGRAKFDHVVLKLKSLSTLSDFPSEKDVRLGCKELEQWHFSKYSQCSLTERVEVIQNDKYFFASQKISFFLKKYGFALQKVVFQI
jgi:hypothetical protein